MKVKKGSTIHIEYTGSFEDGKVFDSSKNHGQPLVFEAGSGMVVPGFDDAVIGMREGEEKEFTLQPEEAYGMPNPELMRAIPKEQFPTEKAIEKGMILVVETPQGQKIPATIADVSDSEITIDFNHPLAGKVLKFKIKVVKIE